MLTTEMKMCSNKAKEGKLSGIHLVNMNPLSNSFCMKMHQNSKVICSICYAIIGLQTFRRNAIGGMERNSRILSEREYSLDEMREIAPHFKPGSIVRLLSYGELTGSVSFRNLCKIPELNPDVRFAMWTKRREIIRNNLGAMPDNLRLIYSTPKINPEPYEITIPRGFDGVFNAFRKDYAFTHRVRINCRGSCMECMKCYDGTESVINEITKRARGGNGVKSQRWI